MRYRGAVFVKSLRKSLEKLRTRHRCVALLKKPPNYDTILPHTMCRCALTSSRDN